MALGAALPSRGKEHQARQLRQEGRGNALASNAVTFVVCCAERLLLAYACPVYDMFQRFLMF